MRSSWRLGGDWEFDAHLRYVDELPDTNTTSYTELNLRAAWRMADHTELAVVGSNLLHSQHQEFTSDFFDFAPISIERNIALQARWVY